MSDAVDRGITVTEIAPMGQPIDVAPETTAAFVGRALRGPLNAPVLVRHYGEFCRRFGGSWSRSSLGPAVKQFFDHGGRQLFVVRVANNARGAMLVLPASGSALVLRAIEPGSTEKIRAAVDYDGIDDDDDELFNLTLQRIDPVSGRVTDQEMFQRLSHVEDTETFVADLLSTSDMVRVEQPLPRHRPDATTGIGRFDPIWVAPVQDGTDGMALSDYDLIGSERRKTGLFALSQTEHFDLLYIPPPGKGIAVGPAAILAAEMLCRRRRAMLVVDPAADWSTAEDVVAGIRRHGYASPNLLSYYPRIAARDDADSERVAGGAIAGLLCKLDRTIGPWGETDHESFGFVRTVRPSVALDDDDAELLMRAGINVVRRGPAGRARLIGSRTLARGSESHRLFVSLPVRRLCLRIVNSIDLATRWAVFRSPEPRLAGGVRAQVMFYLAGLFEAGALATDDYTVECNAGIGDAGGRLDQGITLLLRFHPIGSPEPLTFTLQQTIAGCRVSATAFPPAAHAAAD